MVYFSRSAAMAASFMAPISLAVDLMVCAGRVRSAGMPFGKYCCISVNAFETSSIKLS